MPLPHIPQSYILVRLPDVKEKDENKDEFAEDTQEEVKDYENALEVVSMGPEVDLALSDEDGNESKLEIGDIVAVEERGLFNALREDFIGRNDEGDYRFARLRSTDVLWVIEKVKKSKKAKK